MSFRNTSDLAMYVLYDEKCAFCTRFAAWVSKKNAAMNVLPIRSPEAKLLLRERGENFIDLQTVYFVRGREIFKRSKAAFEIFARLGAPWKFLKYLGYLPKALTDYVYKLFAKYRYSFGKTEESK